jgi:Protein of unknown function (DUF1573)
MASSGRLKPGETGKISVTVNLVGKSGSLTKTVHVYTNDPASPVTNLSVRVNVRKGAVKGQATEQRPLSGP